MARKPKPAAKRKPKRPVHDQEFIWARSEKEARRLQANGWKLAQLGPVHHNHFAMLLVREYKAKRND